MKFTTNLDLTNEEQYYMKVYELIEKFLCQDMTMEITEENRRLLSEEGLQYITNFMDRILRETNLDFKSGSNVEYFL